MGFMQIYAEHGTWYEVTNVNGEGTLVPGDLIVGEPKVEDFVDYIEGGEPESFERLEGWAAHYSAPGYMDQTEWQGVYLTEGEAIDAVKELYGEEDE